MKVKKVETEVVENSLKVFISQPMQGKEREVILEERGEIIEKAGKILNNPDYIDTIFEEGKYSPLECLGKSIEILSKADIAIFPEGYKKARGCKIEHTCCEKYGIPILYI